MFIKICQENVDLLKEQILNLTAERDRAETRAKDKAVLQADLQALRKVRTFYMRKILCFQTLY